MTERYIVVEGSQSYRCCFKFTVVDTTKPRPRPERVPEAGNPRQYEAVCETFREEDAREIARALNANAIQLLNEVRAALRPSKERSCEERGDCCLK